MWQKRLTHGILFLIRWPVRIAIELVILLTLIVLALAVGRIDDPYQ